MYKSKYGFSNSIKNLEHLDQIFDLLNGKYKIEQINFQKYFVVLDNMDYTEVNKLQKKLTKKFYNYKSKILGTSQCLKLITNSEYNKIIEQERIKKEKEIKEKQKLEEIKNKDLLTIFENKDQIKEKRIWVSNNIGEYNWDMDIIAGFWNIIGDRYKVADWKGNILISEEAKQEIENINICNLKGKNFLGWKFKSKGYWHGIVGTYKNISLNKNNRYGVYGLYVDDKLIYIGMTTRDFEIRFNEHKERLETDKLYLYGLLREYKQQGCKLSLKPLIDVTELKVNEKLTERDIKAMELGLIALYQPEGNLAGTKVDYKF